MAGHLYLNCKRNGETFALIYYYGHDETAFALNQVKGLIDYIYDHFEDDYRYSTIRFIENCGGCIGTGFDNYKYVQKLFPDASFATGARDCGLVILNPAFIDVLRSQGFYITSKHVIIDFDNDRIEWDVFKYWSDMNTFMNDKTAEPLYFNNPDYSVNYYNSSINSIPFENMGIVDNLFKNSTIVLDESKAIFAKIE